MARVLINQVLSVCHGKGFTVSVSVNLIGEFCTMARVLINQGSRVINQRA